MKELCLLHWAECRRRHMSVSALKTGCDRRISERRKGLVSIHGALALAVCLPAVHIPLQWPSLHQGGLVSTGQIHNLLGGCTPSQGQRESYRSNEKVLIQIYNEIPAWDKAGGQRIDTRTPATAAITAVNSNTMMKEQSELPCRNTTNGGKKLIWKRSKKLILYDIFVLKCICLFEFNI